MTKSDGSLYTALLTSLTRGQKLSLSTTFGSAFGEQAGSSTTTSSSAKVPKSSDMKSASLGTHTNSTGIQFGSPSKQSKTTTTTTSHKGTSIQKLASNFLSGGLASVASSSLGNLGGLGSLGGIGSIVSGIMSLFKGSSSTPPPLVRFQLPTVENHVVEIGSQSVKQSYSLNSTSRLTSNSGTGQSASGTDGAPGSKAPQASVTSSPSKATQDGQASATNSASSSLNQVNEQWFLDRSNEIAKAVRNAMLNSSSLNDVISEI